MHAASFRCCKLPTMRSARSSRYRLPLEAYLCGILESRRYHKTSPQQMQSKQQSERECDDQDAGAHTAMLEAI